MIEHETNPKYTTKPVTKTVFSECILRALIYPKSFTQTTIQPSDN